jgi:hypothetical protein
MIRSNMDDPTGAAGHERSDARGADNRGDLTRRASSAASLDPVKPTPAAAAG